MQSFIKWMEKHFLPVATVIGNQRHLVAIRDAFVYTMPLMILGAFAVLLNNLPIPGFQDFMNKIFSEQVDKAFIWTKLGGNIWNGTFAVLSIFIAFLVAYNLATSYNLSGLAAGVVSVGSFFTVGGMAGMDSSGLFIALIVGLLSTEIFRILTGNKHLIVKMPDGVPPAVAKSFEALFPAMITIIFWGFVTTLFNAAHIANVVTWFYKMAQQPFMGMASSYPMALLLAFITPLLWFFGLHGANMIEPLMQTINAPSITANLKAFKAGKELPYIVNKPFFDSFVNMGGTGVTIGLLIAILLVGRKNKQYMTVGALAGAPGIFNINEPLTFGLPIVLNPILFIPYILTPMICVTTAYFATAGGLVPAAIAMPPWVTPPIIGGVIATASWQGGVLAAINIVISVAIYSPFVYMATVIANREEKENLTDSNGKAIVDGSTPAGDATKDSNGHATV